MDTDIEELFFFRRNQMRVLKIGLILLFVALGALFIATITGNYP